MAVEITEFVRGTPEHRDAIYLADQYESLDPECYYVTHNARDEEDRESPADYADLPEKQVLTCVSPMEDTEAKTLRIIEDWGYLVDVTSGTEE